MKTFCVGYLSSVSPCYSSQGIIPLPVLLIISVLFFDEIPLSAAGNNDYPYGEHERSNLDPSIGVVLVVLVCAFFMTGCIATYIGGCVNAGAISAAPPYGRYLLPVVSASQQGYRRAIAGLDRSEIESFPVFVYSDVKKLKIGKRALECAVCLAEFDDDETLRLLPRCEHAFHPECIDPWLSVRSSCPVCRSDLVPIAAEIRAGGNELTARPRSSVSGGDESDFSDDVEVIPPGGRGLAEEMVAKPNPAAKFVRSNSTGHSLIVSDRFRLRLPEEVRRQILVEAKMRRAKSFGTLPRSPSSRMGYRSGGEGSNCQSGRLLRWTGLVKSRDGDIAGTSSDAILVAIVVN